VSEADLTDAAWRIQADLLAAVKNDKSTAKVADVEPSHANGKTSPTN